MIENPFSYLDGKLLVTDPEVTFEDFKAFLKFLYTDECEIDAINLKTMLHLGNRFTVANPETIDIHV